jgi:GH15 family glucan-1,4-alpha-glucosidase
MLLLPLVGFLPIEDERIAETVAAVERDLVEAGFLRRWKASAEERKRRFGL